MKLFTQINKCTECVPSCGVWFSEPADLTSTSTLLRALAVDKGYLVMSDALPTSETPHLLMEETRIPEIAEDSCHVWVYRIGRMWKQGYRFIYFSETRPPDAEEFEKEMFDEDGP